MSGPALAVALEGNERGSEVVAEGGAVEAIEQGHGGSDFDVDGEAGAGRKRFEGVGFVKVEAAEGEERAQGTFLEDDLRFVYKKPAGTEAPSDALAGPRIIGRGVEGCGDATVPEDDFGGIAEGAPDAVGWGGDVGAEAKAVHVGRVTLRSCRCPGELEATRRG
jgi:hypothetical protein